MRLHEVSLPVTSRVHAVKLVGMRLGVPAWIFWLDALFFVGLSIHFLWHLRFVHRLPGLDQCPSPSEGPQPTVSVVLAARDEEQRIERTIRRVLEQKGVRLQIIVANDRSTDRTGSILDRLAEEDGRIRVIHINELPAEWLGKCHACHLAARQAVGDWILFTDADCWLHPDALNRALCVAKSDAADHVTLVPGVLPQTCAAAAWHVVFTLSAADWISGVNQGRPGAHLGAGAFNLVRSDIYHRFGGHERLRLSVVDDVKLGLLVARAGGRTRGFLGGSDAECHWGPTLGEAIRIMEKNFYAVVDYRTGFVLGIVLLLWCVWGIALLGLLSLTPSGLGAVAGMLTLFFPALVVCRRLGWSLPAAFLAPVIFPVAQYALLRSMVLTLSRGGVRWRDTFYPLPQLRRGNLR